MNPRRSKAPDEDHARGDSARLPEATLGDPLGATSRVERDEIFAERRARAPVARTDSGAWFVASHAAVREGLMAVDHFVGSFGNTGALPEEETVLPGIPEPRHGLIRKIINSVLAYHQASKVEGFIRETADRLTDDFVTEASNGHSADFVKKVASPLPSTVIAEVLGVPSRDIARFARWSDEILARISESSPGRPLGELHADFCGYVDEQIELRRGSDDPPKDLLTRMLTTEVDGEHLTPRAVRTQIVNLIIAGNDTTRNGIGNLFQRLAANPTLWKRLRGDPSLVPNAIDESLRMDSPVVFLARTCTKPIELGGVPIARGDRVLFGIASANFDEGAIETPNEFRLDRPRARDHMGFGAGPHICPGAFLARLESEAALHSALTRIVSLELDPTNPFVPNPVPFLLGPNELHLYATRA